MGLDYILYRREALGKDGRKIRVYKFRTMELDAEHSWSSVVSANGRDELGKPINDPRLTRIGKTLRRYWIDEIPQLYNIIISRDMSLVGIRPRPEEDWSLFPEGYKESALKQIIRYAKESCIICDIWNMWGTNKILFNLDDLRIKKSPKPNYYTKKTNGISIPPTNGLDAQI